MSLAARTATRSRSSSRTRSGASVASGSSGAVLWAPASTSMRGATVVRPLVMLPPFARGFHVGRSAAQTQSRILAHLQSLSTNANSIAATATSADHLAAIEAEHNHAAYCESRRIMEQTEHVTKVMTKVAQDRGTPVDLYHEIHGHGKHKVLFITGWAGSCDNWRFQTEFFGKHGDFEVCIYENRGSGFSSSPPKDYSMKDMAKDAVDLMNQLGWTSAHVVGVSMGGMIAQELALLAPERIKSLTLASTCSARTLPPMKHIPWLISSFTKIALGLEKVKNLMPHFLYSQRWLNLPAPTNSGFTSNLDYMLKFHGGRIDSRPPQSFSSALRQLAGILHFRISAESLNQLKATFLRSRIPAMVVHGTDDALVHLRSSWDLARMLGARLVVFEGRGHALNHEDIELFNRLLLRHFYTAILPAHGRGMVEEAARRAGWWLSSNMEEGERRAKAMVERMRRQMVGVREWLFSLLFRGVESWGAAAASIVEVEWLPPVVAPKEAPVSVNVSCAAVGEGEDFKERTIKLEGTASTKV
ncbi:Alpha/Beta hydrolase protein [Chytriomyces sp. MP71]|nr:Alpha/Beta hydrolase protein [Chytriomyces sp. MP71]